MEVSGLKSAHFGKGEKRNLKEEKKSGMENVFK